MRILPITGDHGGRVDLVPDKLICTTKELRGDQNDRSGSVSNFLVLLGCQRDEDTGLHRTYELTEMGGDYGTETYCRVSNLEQREDRCAIVCDRDISDIIHQHFVKTR